MLKHLIKDDEEELTMDDHGGVQTKKEQDEKRIENRKELRSRRRQIIFSSMLNISIAIIDVQII